MDQITGFSLKYVECVFLFFAANVFLSFVTSVFLFGNFAFLHLQLPSSERRTWIMAWTCILDCRSREAYGGPGPE